MPNSLTILLPKLLLKSMSTFIVLAILLTASVSPLMARSLYDKILFYPIRELDKVPSTINGIEREELFISSIADKKLHAWLFVKHKDAPVVLLSHGNAGNISHRVHLINLFLKQGLSVLAYDYQGYGKSEGSPTINNVCADGLAAFDYLIAERKIDPERIILYGESLGGGITCSIASQRKCGAIILQSTFSSLPSVGKKVMKVFNLVPSIFYPKNKMDNTLVVKQEHAPLLIIHGEEDEIIPYSEAVKLNSCAIEPKEFVTIKNAGHNNIYPSYERELSSAISTFLSTKTNFSNPKY